MPALQPMLSRGAGTPPQTRTLALLPVLLALAGGCAHKPRAQVYHAPKPWLQAQSLCIFPMSQDGSAKTPEALDSALSDGWESRMRLPPAADIVRIEGAGAYPRVDAMTIDLSDASVDPRRATKKLKPVGKPEGSVRVDTLAFIARPLLVERAKLLLGMTASGAKLDLRRDKKGRPMLTLSDVRDGQLSLEVAKKDIDALLLKSAREAAGKFGVSVDRTRLKLDVVDGRSLRADLKIDTRFGILPAGLRFKARVDVDDELNGRIKTLSCEGDQLLGPIISGVISPARKKYEGKKRPLVGFPWGHMKLKDFELRLDESFHLDLKFGSPTGGAKDAPKPRATY